MIDNLDPQNKQKVEELILQIHKVTKDLEPILGRKNIQKNIEKSLDAMVKKNVITDDDKNEILQKIGYNDAENRGVVDNPGSG